MKVVDAATAGEEADVPYVTVTLYVPLVHAGVPPAVKRIEYVPDPLLPLTCAEPTATLEPEGLAIRTKTAVPLTLPEAAVTLPETVIFPPVVTEEGEALTVTESTAVVVTVVVVVLEVYAKVAEAVAAGELADVPYDAVTL